MPRTRSTPAAAEIQGDAAPPEKGALSGAGGIVLRLLRATRERQEGVSFLLRRALREIDTTRGDEGSVMDGVVSALLPGRADALDRTGASGLGEALLLWAGFLEAGGQLKGATTVLQEAIEWCPEDPELVLHAARVARKDGDSERAHALYLRVRHQAAPSRARLARMAEVGLALLTAQPEAELGGIVRRAVVAEDQEVAAVAHEERAAIRRRRGDRLGALRDYGAACLRFSDPADRGRVVHAAADVLVTAGDPLAARKALLEVESVGLPAQWDRARCRLREISRSVGDELGLRRWRNDGIPGLVSLAPRRRGFSNRSIGPDVSRWIDRLRGYARPVV